MRLIPHAGRFQRVSPFSTFASVTTFQMLAKLVSTKEFLGSLACARFMYAIEMSTTCFPIRSWLVWKLFTTVEASIECWERGGRGRGLRLGGTVFDGWCVSGGVECAIETPIEGRTRPGVFSQMKRIFMTLGFIFVLEPIRAEIA